ncbi:MAG TPA: GNAT family N-acetyltransferase, partial [Acidimicrobiales bacterium]|nr:GNAT family N-acetyltransferase [Acidimicrobiales bacterium]
VAAARADERPGGRIATVDLIYVEPQARRVGVGDALMELLLSWAAAQHCTGIDITVLPGDQASKSLLETWEFSARALTLYRTVELAPSEASSGEGVAAAEGGAHAHAARPEGATASSEGADAGGGHPSASPRRVPCAGAVVIDQGRLLLVRRANPPDAGCWSLPGGRVEAGEDGAAAAVRETLEETGCRVVVERSAGHAVIDGASVTYDIEDFYATLVDPREQPSPGGDAAEAVFVPLDDVSDLELASGLGDWLTRHGIVPGR